MGVNSHGTVTAKGKQEGLKETNKSVTYLLEYKCEIQVVW